MGINIDVPPAGRRGSIEVDLVEVLVLLFLPDLSVAVSVLVPDSVCVPVSLAVPVEVFFPLLESVAVESAVLVSDAESVLLALESVFVSSDAVVSIKSACEQMSNNFCKLTSSGHNFSVCHVQPVLGPWPSRGNCSQQEEKA